MGRVPSRGSEQFIVRFPDGMRDRLKAAAAENGRSMNAEIVQRLEESFRHRVSPVLMGKDDRDISEEAVPSEYVIGIIGGLLNAIADDPKLIESVREKMLADKSDRKPD